MAGVRDPVSATAVVVVALAVATLAGAAQERGSSELTGRTWQLDRLAGIDRSRLGITARFTTGGKVSGFSGCNQYSGTYTTAGSRISISKVASTQMACRRLVMLQESAYLGALGAARGYSVESGTLKLKGRAGLTLASFEVQSQSLAGTDWHVISYNNGKQAVVSVAAATKLTASFDDKGNLTGFAGCNDYSATVKTTPPKISFGPVTSTRKACSTPDGVMEQEAAYLAALATAATYRLEGTKLELRTASDTIAADFASA